MLLSCLGKLFTYIINNRLNSWAEDNSAFAECQFGFRQNKSTVDCLFILNGLIQYFLNYSLTLYCSFIDLTKAFDSIDRNVLWFKLQKSGISCKLINLIKNMYSKIRLSVKKTCSQISPGGISNDFIDEFTKQTQFESKHNLDDISDFTSFSGVFQGECLSPFLFSMFVNDLSDFLADANDVGITLNEIVITALLFAHNIIIFSISRNGLQKELNSIKAYCGM